MLSSGDKTGVEQEPSSGYSLDEMIAHIEAVRYYCDNLSTGGRNVRSQARETHCPTWSDSRSVDLIQLGVLGEAVPSATSLLTRSSWFAAQEQEPPPSQ